MKGVFSHITVAKHFHGNETCKCTACCLKEQSNECGLLDGKISLTENLLFPHHITCKVQYIFVTKHRDYSSSS